MPRDEMIRIALEVGIARRSDDAAGLVRGWARAREALLHFPVDLFSLLPLGELLMAGARLHEEHRLEPHLADAWQLLERLGGPSVWTAPLHWSGVQAAILTGQPSPAGPARPGARHRRRHQLLRRRPGGGRPRVGAGAQRRRRRHHRRTGRHGPGRRRPGVGRRAARRPRRRPCARAGGHDAAARLRT
ncbi:hypothetical protein [Georgenia sp. SUBG003]|uniref:hypothetical protein n=1 Tax=Georgenia sp. SUBG003 TaxID=1497974 RepID=UPI003AB709D3